MSERPTDAVWVTRPKPGAERTARALRQAGLSAFVAPVLEVRCSPPEQLPPTDPSWLILVSANAASCLDHALRRAGRALPLETRIAAVGNKTAEAARSLGWRAQVVPKEQTAAGLLTALADQTLCGSNVWIPSGNRRGSATDELPRALRKKGAEVTVLSVYESVARLLSPAEKQTVLTSARAIVFHSPSAVDAALDEQGRAVAELIEARQVVAIGPVTARRLRERGIEEMIEAATPADAAVVEALEASGYIPRQKELP